MRRATLQRLPYGANSYISIHALLAESDTVNPYRLTMIFGFLSTLSLRRATQKRKYTNKTETFLSTLSLRRATLRLPTWAAKVRYFYPRSPCGERQIHANPMMTLELISIHALLAESDLQNWRKPHGQKTFLSTLSLRRATSKKSPLMCFIRHFYPRSPCGERQTAY